MLVTLERPFRKRRARRQCWRRPVRRFRTPPSRTMRSCGKNSTPRRARSTNWSGGLRKWRKSACLLRGHAPFRGCGLRLLLLLPLVLFLFLPHACVLIERTNERMCVWSVCGAGTEHERRNYRPSSRRAVKRATRNGKCRRESLPPRCRKRTSKCDFSDWNLTPSWTSFAHSAVARRPAG